MILITGGLGYLGGRIAKYLNNFGYDIRIGTSRVISNHLKKSSPFELVRINLEDLTSLRESCNNVSVIIHLAAMNAEECSIDPKNALIVNSEGTSKLINAAISQGVNKFIYFSTAHVYGSPLEGKLSENIRPNPKHPYSNTHFLAENFLIDATKKKLIDGLVLRLSNAVGPPVSSNVNCWKLVSNDLCWQAVTKKRILVESSRYLERDFIAIREVCRLINNIIGENLLKNGTYNLSSGSSTNLLDLASLIKTQFKKVSKQSIEIIFNSHEATSIKKNIPLTISNDKLQKNGFTVDKDISSEIKDLLINCHNWFLK